MHWAEGVEGKGALLSGDLLQVCADRKFVSFMCNHPNYTPLSSKAVQAVATRVQTVAVRHPLSAFWDRVIPEDAKRIAEASVARRPNILERGSLRRKTPRKTVLNMTVWHSADIVGRKLALETENARLPGHEFLLRLSRRRTVKSDTLLR
jgi:hypothetical protein